MVERLNSAEQQTIEMRHCSTGWCRICVATGGASLAPAIAIQDQRREGNALGDLGVNYDSLGGYKKVINYQQKHLAIAITIKVEIDCGNAMRNLGNADRGWQTSRTASSVTISSRD